MTDVETSVLNNHAQEVYSSLGISEVCDAVTVVVSEETGRISLAIDGELIAVNRENFSPESIQAYVQDKVKSLGPGANFPYKVYEKKINSQNFKLINKNIDRNVYIHELTYIKIFYLLSAERT